MTNGRKDIPTYTLHNLRPPYLDYPYFADGARHPFRHGSKKFELVNAWWLAEAATLVYADPSFVVENFKRAGLPVVAVFDRGGTQCFVASNDDFAVVAFRGTESSPRRGAPDSGLGQLDFRDVFIDFAADLDFLPDRFEQGGSVHRGFKRAVDSVWLDHEGSEGVAAYLSRLNADGRARTVWVTGHSLGAALATLAAARCGNLQGVYTYGSPRVGDAAFVNAFDRIMAEKFGVECYRFVNYQDVVTTVPPHGVYRHVGSLKYIDRGGVIRDNPTVIERLRHQLRGVLTLPFDALGRLKSGFIQLIPEGLIDHAPTLYAIHIWNTYVEGLR